MHLRSISLKGFKSFPDRTKLDFSPGVSVIVGPNGSGKSNITDAVLWAMGEQSPSAVRGQSMQDVIFAGAHGVQARQDAEVEVVLDNADGSIGLPAGEISIMRRLDRAGEGEYRVNGAKCRLGDVIELLSDTGLGKEMHSVVSQGRVEAIVTSKPKDRRMLIEEAAGLGKHRKRRRRAQLKLERTQDNLDRALDIEREARSRLKPLKRQAEAAELHERIARQSDEALWALARDTLRGAQAALSEAEGAVGVARAGYGETEKELGQVAERRVEAERALAARGTEREAVASRVFAARSAGERLSVRLEAARNAASLLEERAMRRRGRLEALEADAQTDVGDEGADERIAELEAELEQLAQDRAARIAREVAELEERAEKAAASAAELAGVLGVAQEARKAADATAEAARGARREAEAAAEAARREAAKVGADLAAVNQFLRSQAGAPGGAASLADALRAEPGYELALAAALGPRLRAAVARDLDEAGALLDRAGGDGGAALVLGEASESGAAGAAPPLPDAVRLLDVIAADGDGAPLARALLADAWVVGSLDTLPSGFAGTAVTRDGRVWSAATRELRQVPAGGEDRVLAERNRRDALVAETERTAQAEQAALAAVEAARAKVAELDGAREEADRAARAAGRAHADAVEAERHARHLIEQRTRTPDEGPAATRRAQVAAALGAERKLLERAERERQERAKRSATERVRLERDTALIPRAEKLAAALEDATAALADRLVALEADLTADRAAGEELTQELRACAALESQVQARLKERGEAVTRAEVRAQQLRDQATDADHAVAEVAERLGLEATPAEEALPEEERVALLGRVERLARRREQLGPVNPLAQDEYAEAIAHVEELEAQREDLESAMRELKTLIRDTDKRIRESFEETFTAAAKNFEEVVGELFPGGRGRLRLVKEDSGPRPVLGGQDAAPATDAEADAEEAMVEEALEAAAEAEESREEDLMGVEIEITPAGKSTKRLSLLSGGEKSMTALAFLFAVFLARPCPFYILDEVEAALDDLNIDRFLNVLRSFSDRAQFIVVTHQKRTMEAADCLYGVSMAGNGVSKVVSRRLPRDTEPVPHPDAPPVSAVTAA